MVPVQNLKFVQTQDFFPSFQTVKIRDIGLKNQISFIKIKI